MARARYLYCSPVTQLPPKVVSFEGVDLQEASALTSRWHGVLEHGGARLYLKVYEGGAMEDLEASINAVVEANRLVARRFSGVAPDLERLSRRLIECGVAPVLLVCRGAVEGAGEVIGLAAPYVDSSESLLSLAMPHVAGSGGGLEESEVRRLFCGLLKVVATLQSLGVVHGDIKPSNVLLADGRPVLVDFDGAVPAEYGRPVFQFNPGDADLAEFDGVSPDASNPYALDWLGVLYTGAFLAHASRPAVEARAGASRPTVDDPSVRRAFESVLGSAFVEDLEALLGGSGPPAPRPVVRLLERLRGEGVCA